MAAKFPDYTKLRQVTVRIYCKVSKFKRLHGAGVVLNKDGLILSLSKVVNEGSIIQVFFYGIEHYFEADFLRKDTRHDLALIKLRNLQITKHDELKIKAAELGRVGPFLSELVTSKIFAVCHPRDFLSFSVLRGDITHKHRHVKDLLLGYKDCPLDQEMELLQLNNIHICDRGSKFAKSSFGSPIFDDEGKLIGLLGFHLKDVGYFVIPMPYIYHFLWVHRKHYAPPESEELVEVDN